VRDISSLLQWQKLDATKLEIKEIPITFNDRAAGKSKMSNQIITESLFLATKFGIQRVFHRNRDDK
jgi:hypothetical protein